MIVYVLLHSRTIPPLPTTDTTDAVICRAAVAVVSDVVGEDIVSGVGQMFVLEHKVDLEGVVVAPRLAKMPRETGTTHGQSVIEDDELVALPPLAGKYHASRGVPSSDGIKRSCQPAGHPITGVLKRKLRNGLTMLAMALTLA
jgi:hypothetical protein